MAYQRSGAGARALHGTFHRRRAAIKRALRQSRLESAYKVENSIAQEVIIGPGGAANLQPVEESSSYSRDIAATSPHTSMQGHAEDITMVPDSQPSAYGNANAQLHLNPSDATSLSPHSTSLVAEIPIQNTIPTPAARTMPVNSMRPTFRQPSNSLHSLPSPAIAPLVAASASVCIALKVG